MIRPDTALSPQQSERIQEITREISSLTSNTQNNVWSGIRDNPEASCIQTAANLLAGAEGEFAYREMRNQLLDTLLFKSESIKEGGDELKAVLLYTLSPMPEMTARDAAVYFPSLPDEIVRSQMSRSELYRQEPMFDLSEEAVLWSHHHSANPEWWVTYPHLAVLLMPRNMQEWADNVSAVDHLLAEKTPASFSLYEIQKTLNFALVSVQRYLATRAAQAADGQIPPRDAALFKQGLDTLYQGALGNKWLRIQLQNYSPINGAALALRQSVLEGNHIVFKRRFAGGFLMNGETCSIESQHFVYPLVSEQAFGSFEELSRSSLDKLSDGVVDGVGGGAKDVMVNVGPIGNLKGFGNYVYLDGTPEQEQAALHTLDALYSGARQASQIHEAALCACGEIKEVLRTNLIEMAVAISKHDDGGWLEHENAIDRLLQRAAAIVATGTVSGDPEVKQVKDEINLLRSLVANEDKVLPSSAFFRAWVRPSLYNGMVQTFFRALHTELEHRQQTETKTLEDIRVLARNLKERLGQDTIGHQLKHIMQYVLTAPMLCPNADMSRTWFFEKMNDGLNELIQALKLPKLQSEEPAHDAFMRFKESVRFQEKMDLSVAEEADPLDNMAF